MVIMVRSYKFSIITPISTNLNMAGTSPVSKWVTYFLGTGVTINNLSGTGNTSNLVTCNISGGYTITGSIETNGINLCPP